MSLQNDDLDNGVFDDEGNAKEVISEKLADLGTPGYQAEFDPLEAEQVGAFIEDAMTEEDALDSSSDLAEDVG